MAVDPFTPLPAPKCPPVRMLAADLLGIHATPVEIQASIIGATHGPPRIIGLPDAAVREAYDRVKTAFGNLDLKFPRGRVVVNLAPARTRKAGSGFDLGIALALACLSGALPRGFLAGMLVVGELGLDGSLRGIPGILPIAELADRIGVPRLLCPEESAPLAQRAATGTRVLPAAHLEEALLLCREGPARARPVPDYASPSPGRSKSPPDLGRVRGQESARQALLVAAVGGHNLMASGPPGCGKSLLARCLQGILPPLGTRQRLEVLKIRSALSAEEPPDSHDILERGLPPFRAPHHTVSYAGLVGGGSPPRPGEITLAHRGVLFLDELPEFQRQSLEALRQPLELGSVHIRRSDSSLEFPAAFQLITAMNPCPCGYLGHPSRPCSDTPQQIQRYRARISGPLLDRIDIHLQLLPVHAEELLDPHEPEDPLNPRLQRRVAELRRVQRERNGGRLNTELEENELRRPDHLTGGARRLLILTCRGGRLSARGITRVLRVARSLADLAEAPSIQEEQLAAALHYRVR